MLSLPFWNLVPALIKFTLFFKLEFLADVMPPRGVIWSWGDRKPGGANFKLSEVSPTIWWLESAPTESMSKSLLLPPPPPSPPNSILIILLFLLAYYALSSSAVVVFFLAKGLILWVLTGWFEASSLAFKASCLTIAALLYFIAVAKSATFSVLDRGSGLLGRPSFLLVFGSKMFIFFNILLNNFINDRKNWVLVLNLNL